MGGAKWQKWEEHVSLWSGLTNQFARVTRALVAHHKFKKELFQTLLIYYMHQFRKHDTQLINITLNNANKYIILNVYNLINFSDRLLIFRLLCDISGRI